MAQAKRGYGSTGGEIGPVETKDFAKQKEEDKSAPKTTTPSGGWSSPPVKTIGNYGGLVLVLSVVLFLFTFWTPVVVPVWDTLWNGKSNTISRSQWQITSGGFVFIITMTIFGSITGTSELALMTVLGLWAVFLIMNGTKQLGTVLDWFGGKTYTPDPVKVPPPGPVPQPAPINVPPPAAYVPPPIKIPK